MKNFKHYSFDLWQTLIKSNPKFKKSRALHFYENYNFNGKSITEIEYIFRQTDLMCNKVTEITGKHIDYNELYLFVLYQINGNLDFISAISISKLYKDIENILLEYPPVFYSADTPVVLEKLKTKNTDITFNILSNTAFIAGSTLIDIIRTLGIYDYFEFFIFSDEVGFSKPNIEIYKLLWGGITKSRKDLDTLRLADVVHIGDNYVADICGAQNYGIHAFQINSNEKTILDLGRYAA